MEILYVAPLLFLAVSFVLPMLGLGGSQLYIPILYWLGMDFKTQAIPLGLLLTILASSSAALNYGRSGLVNFRLALPFALSMAFCAPLGAFFNFYLPVKPVILVFAIFSLGASVLVLSGWVPEQGILEGKKVALGIAAGALLGFTAGLVGRGGGAFIMPLLLLAGLDAKKAAATSCFIVAFAASAAFLSHLWKANLDLPVALITSAAVLLGSSLGSRFMMAKLKSEAIRTAFGILLILVAVALLKDVFL